MRFAPVALVLVVGAGVVLWFGNTLNSWVLGGLIGGLAALLISIPISLTLFFHFSQQHEERLRAQEELALADAEAYEEEAVEVYKSNDYRLSEQQRWYEEEKPPQSPRRNGTLPASSCRAAFPRLGNPLGDRDRDSLGLASWLALANRCLTSRRMLLGFSGYQGSDHSAASIRQRHYAPRWMRPRRQDGRTGKTSAYPTRKSSSARSTTPFEQADRTGELRSTRDLARQNPNQQSRPRRAVEGTALPSTSTGSPRSLCPYCR